MNTTELAEIAELRISDFPPSEDQVLRTVRDARIGITAWFKLLHALGATKVKRRAGPGLGWRNYYARTDWRRDPALVKLVEAGLMVWGDQVGTVTLAGFVMVASVCDIERFDAEALARLRVDRETVLRLIAKTRA